MKKRILMFVLMLALLIAATVITAQAATVPENVEWIELGSEEDFLEWFGGATSSKNLKEGYTANMTRYYKMTADITVDQDSTVWYLAYGSYAVNVYFDLNGHTFTYTSDKTAATRMFGTYVAGTTHTFVNGTIVNNSAINAYGAMFMLNQGSFVGEDLTIIDNADDMSFSYGGKIFSAVGEGYDITLTNVDITTGAAANNNYGLAIRSESGDLTMTNCNLTSVATKRTSYGGLIYKIGGNLSITNCTFTDGFAKYGGQVYSKGAVSVNITGSTFTNGRSEAGGMGGDLYVQDSPANVTGCTFTNKGATTPDFGGSVFFQTTGTVKFKDCDITGGKAKHGGAFYSVNAALTMENCSITGGQATVNGGNAQIKNGTATLTNTAITDGKATGDGGNVAIANSAKVYFKSGRIEGGSAKNGGNVASAIASKNGCTLDFQGMTVTGGTATGNGGNIYAAAASGYDGYPTVKLSAGTVTDGTATGNGGNIYLGGMDKETVTNSDGTTTSIAKRTVAFTMTGGTVGGEPAQGKTYAGEAETGGNIFAQFTTMAISGGEISNSHAKDIAGNIYVSTACTATVSGTAVVSGGYAEDRGGNFYMSSTNSVLNIQGGTVKDGRSKNAGGNIFQGNGKLTVTGGVITGGASETYGGNVYASMGYGTNASACGALTLKDDGDAQTPLAQITDGSAMIDGGNIYVACGGNTAANSEKGAANKLVLGNFVVSGGDALINGDNLFIAGVTLLEILPEFSQELSCYISTSGDLSMFPEKIPGAALANGRGKSSGVFTGKLIVENLENIFIYAKADDTNLYFAGAAIVDENGAKTWYQDNAAALAADKEGVLQVASGELALDGGDYIVDIAGNTVAITGTGTVTLFDSANDTFKTFGTATVNGPELKNAKLQEANGKLYYMLEENGTYSFHCVEVKLITASMRPSIGGIYYTGRWSCDEVLASHIGGFGVAASVKEMPGDDFADKAVPTAKWTVFGASEFESGISRTGVMISGILKDAAAGADQDRIAKNSEYAQMDVFAKAYITIDGVNYTGGGLSYSLYDILKTVSDNIEEYAANADTLQSFMAKWSANGLTGEPWDSLNFQVDAAIESLNALYADKKAYYGELHDHANTGGTSDGKQTLDVWKSELQRLQMDFATIVDHKQSSHMYLEEWDTSIFIGGSEAACTITTRTGVRLHYNMIFSDPEGLENVVSSFSEFNWKYYPEDYTGTNAAKLAGGWHFDYPSFTAERFTEVCQAVYANGGFVSLVHPKSDGYIESDDPADAFFMDGMAIEVFYTYQSTRNGWKVKANYELWKSMIDMGYKVYASAGNDEHDMPSDKAVSVIHATERDADAYVESLRGGNFVAGGVDVRTAIGDTAMGGTTSFTGKRMALSVNGFHVSLYNPYHTYRVDVITDKGVAYSQEISCTENFYYAFDVDADAMYYYVEIHDVTDQSMLAIGNPIWNADK